MLFKAATEHDISLENSWMIGDILNDVEAGNRAGCKTVLIDNGNETEWVERVTAHQLSHVKPLTKLPTGFNY
jgi:phosphoglycolate phosphatase-like HAD superfamily hydrolase